jgi:hypothetical protein
MARSLSIDGHVENSCAVMILQQVALVKFVLLLENRHVQREMPIDIKISSHQDWHRHRVWDDFWRVIYRVLPPM